MISELSAIINRLSQKSQISALEFGVLKTMDESANRLINALRRTGKISAEEFAILRGAREKRRVKDATPRIDKEANSLRLIASRGNQKLIEGLLCKLAEGQTESREHWRCQRIFCGEPGNQGQAFFATPVNLRRRAVGIDRPVLIHPEFPIQL